MEETSREQAKRDFKKGVELFLEKRYGEAKKKFETSYGARPKPIVLFNLAMCHKALLEFAKSYECFERFLEMADDTDRAVPVAKEALLELDALVGFIEIDADTPEGSSVELDGQVVGNTPLPGPIRVNPGRYALKVTSLDEAVFQKSIEVSSRETELVRPRFEQESKDPFVPPPDEKQARERKLPGESSQVPSEKVRNGDTSLGKKRIGAIIAGGMGFAAAGASGYFGYQRQFVDLRDGRAEAQKGTVEGDQDKLDEINERGQRHVVLAAVCGGAAAVLVGAAIALWVSEKREETTERRVKLTGSGVMVAF